MRSADRLASDAVMAVLLAMLAVWRQCTRARTAASAGLRPGHRELKVLADAPCRFWGTEGRRLEPEMRQVEREGAAAVPAVGGDVLLQKGVRGPVGLLVLAPVLRLVALQQHGKR